MGQGQTQRRQRPFIGPRRSTLMRPSRSDARRRASSARPPLSGRAGTWGTLAARARPRAGLALLRGCSRGRCARRPAQSDEERRSRQLARRSRWTPGSCHCRPLDLWGHGGAATPLLLGLLLLASVGFLACTLRLRGRGISRAPELEDVELWVWVASTFLLADSLAELQLSVDVDAVFAEFGLEL